MGKDNTKQCSSTRTGRLHPVINGTIRKKAHYSNIHSSLFHKSMLVYVSVFTSVYNVHMIRSAKCTHTQNSLFHKSMHM